MRIWVIGRGFPSKQNNMLGSFEFEQAQMLAKHGHEVYYPVFDIRSARRWRKFGIVRTLAGNVTVVTLSIPIGFFYRFFSVFLKRKLFLLLKKYLFNNLVNSYGVPDVIHVHYPCLYSYEPLKVIHSLGVKLIGTEHYTKVQNKEISDKELNNLCQAVKCYDEILCVGEPLREAIKELTGTNREIFVVPNIVPDIFNYHNSQDQCLEREQCFRFVGVGRLVECKRFDLMIKAFVRGFKENKKVKLDIIGNGKEYNHLKQIIHDSECEDQVSLLGIRNREEIADYYHRCNALIMASNLETFGVPIIEAMASGLPVVTTDAMGFRSLFHDEFGYVVPADDENALASAMRRLYDNYDSFDRNGISEYARKTFGEDTVYEQLKSIYER